MFVFALLGIGPGALIVVVICSTTEPLSPKAVVQEIPLPASLNSQPLPPAQGQEPEGPHDNRTFGVQMFRHMYYTHDRHKGAGNPEKRGSDEALLVTASSKFFWN